MWITDATGCSSCHSHPKSAHTLCLCLQDLLHLTEMDLLSLGVQSRLHRIHILSSIQVLQERETKRGRSCYLCTIDFWKYISILYFTLSSTSIYNVCILYIYCTCIWNADLHNRIKETSITHKSHKVPINHSGVKTEAVYIWMDVFSWLSLLSQRLCSWLCLSIHQSAEPIWCGKISSCLWGQINRDYITKQIQRVCVGEVLPVKYCVCTCWRRLHIIVSISSSEGVIRKPWKWLSLKLQR